MIFDVKMKYFRRQTEYVTQDNFAEALVTLTHASIVSRKNVRIALNIAPLDDLEVETLDINNS